MRTVFGRILVGVTALSLGLLAAACDDGNKPAEDMASPDLSAIADMTADPDMAMPPEPGSGQVLVADVFGTGWVATATNDAGEAPVPFVHSVTAVATFPALAGKSDYSDVVVTVTAGTIVGCATNRYTIPGDPPAADVNAGTVTLSGYYTKRLASTGGTNFVSNIPATIECKNPGGATPFYDCKFAGTAAANSAAGLTSKLPFPAIPQGTWNALCGALGNCAPSDCNTSQMLGGTTTCEQNLFAGDGGTAATITTAGGEGYNMYTTTGLVTPPPVRIFSIKVGGTEVGSGPTTTTLAALQGKLDPTKDVEISWSCNATDVAGAGCKAGFLEPHVILAGQTSPTPRANFTSPSANFGTMTCFSPGAIGKITLKAAGVAEFLGKPTPQNTGSAQLALIYAGVKASILAGVAGQRQLHAAGNGQFAFINFP